MLDARIYRAALVPVLLAVIVCAFSLQDQPAAVTTTLAPDAFSGSRAQRDLADLARAFPVRRAGDAADAALGRRVAEELRGMAPAYEVGAPSFRGETIDGERTLTTVLGRQVGAPGPELVVVAHRDAAARGARAELSGTAVMLELARVVGGGRLRRTVTFVSTSGGSGGAAGARDLARRLSGNPVDAVLVLGDLGSARLRRPIGASWSDGSELGPLVLRRTVADAVRQEAGTGAGAPGVVTQWTRLAFPGTPAEQGPLVAAGLPAVLMSASGERPPAADARVSGERLEAFGRATLRALLALDESRALDAAPSRDVVTLRKVLPGWAVRLLIGALLVAPLLVAVDGFARARRRREPVGPWLGWIGAAAAPFALAAALVTVLGLTGLLAATPPAPVPAGAIPVDGAARAALIAAGLVIVLGIVARPALLRLLHGRPRPAGPGAGVALVLAWCLLAAILWLFNPFAAAFMVPAAHLWLLLAAPGVRMRRGVALALVALSLAPFAIAALVLSGQLGLGPLDFGWAALLWVAGAHIGPFAWLFWSAATGCALAAVVLAWRTRPAPRTPEGEPRITVRGPLTYAGPGSLGGTESALRR
ncbi:MAG TPA: M28 family peptidase [Solirubrobacteraceae bacterium]|nr:M28 family peptidase [Solirubrobacteraceae bacterium]